MFMCLDEEETNDMVVLRGALQSNGKSEEERESGEWRAADGRRGRG